MLLVFSKTTGYRHASIEDGVAALRTLANEYHIEMDATENSAVFTDDNLTRYQAIIFLSTSGDILDESQKLAFERYIQSGGGYVGIHTASATEYNWVWYGQLVGAFFKDHPALSQATIQIEDSQHASTASLPERWIRTDEWYNFRANPREHVHILLTVDETTYQGGTMGVGHPLAWYHEFDGGRSWYTALGHTSESFAEPLFLAHLWGGIFYAANLIL